jgi:oxygen-dependent protoporphyrinogen oxidase
MTGPKPTVAVVGGGVSGLAAAWELVHGEGGAGGAEVVVLEADRAPGGKIGTTDFGGRRLDLGPDAFVTRRPEALALCRQLGLEDELVAPATTTAYLLVDGRLRSLPAGLVLGVPTRIGPLARSGILSGAGLGRAALDLVTPRGGGGRPLQADDSVGHVVRRRLGPEVAERLADPLIGGIHAGNADEMSAAAVFPALLAADARSGSLMRNLGRTRPAPAKTATGTDASLPVFMGLGRGMGRLVDTLVAALRRAGVAVHTGARVQRLERRQRRWVLDTAPGAKVEADAVVLAVPAPVAASLLRPHSAALAQQLDSIAYASVTLVTMRFTDPGLPRLPPGSGFLVPRTSGGLVTACTWLSAKWAQLSRPGELLLRASLGRYGDDRAAAMDDDEVLCRALGELAPAMGLGGRPEESMVARFRRAFPQYAVGHVDKIAAVQRRAADLGGVAIAGAALHGVGIPACIASGRAAGRAVLSQLEEPAWR